MAIIKTTVSDKLDFDAAITELREYFSSLGARKGRQLTYNVLTYGCQLNESDSEKLSGMLASMGLTASSGGELDDADVIVFNTCSIRENADRHLFGNLGVFKTLKKNDRDVVIAVGGCMMKVPENVERIKKSYPYVDLVFDPQQLHRFPVLMRDAIRKDKQLVNISADDYIAEDNFFPIDRKRKFRALVPIMYGCNNFCTYCIVPYRRGKMRSRQKENVINEAKYLVEQGYQEIVLSGIHVGGYGQDLENCSFSSLVEELTNIEGLRSLRISSIEESEIDDKLIELIQKKDNLAKHLHIPLQSGSNHVLKMMGRKYTREQFIARIKQIKKLVPNVMISGDVIVGFPQETEQDFMDSYSLCEECFDMLHVFPYSMRPGTAAARMNGQISPEVKKERSKKLLELSDKLYAKYANSFIGQDVTVLIEKYDEKQQAYVGHTSNYLEVKIPLESKVGEYKTIKLQKDMI